MMNTKKTKRANLERHRTNLFLIGMAISLSALWMAFEYKTTDIDKAQQQIGSTAVDFTEFAPNTIQEPPKPQPKIDHIKIEIVDNSKIVIDDFKIDEFDPDEDIEPYVPEDGFDDDKLVDEENHLVNPWDLSSEPSFPGGHDAMMEFIVSNIEYPEIARQIHIEGKVFVSFIVEKDGSLSNVQVARGISEECDNEAVKVVKMMPRWTPGKQMGKNVRVRLSLPIVFTLQ